MSENVNVSLPISCVEQLAELFGNMDENIAVLHEELGVNARLTGNEVAISGEQEGVRTAQVVLQKLLQLLQKGEHLDRTVIRYAIDLAREGNADGILGMVGNVMAMTVSGKPIKPRTLGQQAYVAALKKDSVVLAVGPAGTGKTYLAMAMAVTALKNREVSRIILSRPAVEAGERLGFLPGDLQQKVDPYLRPLYDALHQLLGPDALAKLQEKGVIEVAPLAYMRGRTLNDAYIILDEGQNTTREQMKMFLTRMGQGSRMAVTGDITQIDLPEGKKSGLVEAVQVLGQVPGISTITLTQKDVVRHEMVQRIIRAYENFEKKKKS